MPQRRKWSFHPPLPSRVAAHLPLPHLLSPLLCLSDKATLPQPSPVEDSSLPERQPADALIWTRPPKLKVHISPPSLQQHSATQPDSNKALAKCSKPTKGSYIIRKQATNPTVSTKKMSIVAADVKEDLKCSVLSPKATLHTQH